MKNIQIFEKNAQKYDAWFDENTYVYQSEIQALKRFIPQQRNGVEIGVGTGRFSVPFSIKIGVEPAQAMANIAQKRGITVYNARAEALPFHDASFDYVLMVTTICFLQSLRKAFKEATRVLKPGGKIIIGMIDKDSPLGKMYESKKNESTFYRYAHFYSVEQIVEQMKKLQYTTIEICQTLFENPKDIHEIEPIKEGYGKGGFVVISAHKPSRR